MGWRKFPVSLTELSIDTTLRCGQSFRWRKSEDDIWSCALHGRLLSLRQDRTHLYYRVQWPSTSKAPLTPPSSVHNAAAAATDDDAQSSPSPDDDNDGNDDSNDDTEAFLRHYLNLGPNLTALYEQWSRADANFKKKAPRFTGVRILRQDAWEALVGFICSSNNNIARISQMMEKLCVHYGLRIGSAYDGDGRRDFYDMPSPAALSGRGVEAHLRELGFGYRAKYLHQTAVIVAGERPDGWLDGLRNPESPAFIGGSKAGANSKKKKKTKKTAAAGNDDDSSNNNNNNDKKSTMEERPNAGREGYRAAHEQLLALQGVGPKVADCVCLMGLGWGEAVPVDTHVWQIAVRDYRFGRGKHSSMTKATYDAVGDHFRRLWDTEAGWAHSVLFTADLRQFAERLAAKIELTEDVETTADGQVKVKVEQTVKAEVISPVKKTQTKKKKRGSAHVDEEEEDEDGETIKEEVIEEKTTTTARSFRAKRRRR